MSKKKQKKAVTIGDNLDGDRHLVVPMESRYIQILIVLTIIAFFLRIYNLGFNSLWLDEAATNMISMKSFTEIWQTTISGEFNPPLFYWMEHVMIMVFGSGEFVLRLLPAIFGIITIPIIYLVGTEYRDRNVGIIAASAFTFSAFLIYYSQEARAYSAMLFFMTCAILFYFKALKYNDIKNWAIFGVFSALAFWCHFYAFVMIASCMSYVIIDKFKDIRNDINYIKPFLVSVITFIGLCLPLIIVTINLFGKRTSSAPTYGIQGLNIITETFYQVSGYSLISMYVFLILFIIGIICAFIVDKERATFLVWSMISIFVVSYFLSFKIPMIPRYLQFLNIIFFIGIGMSYKFFNNGKLIKSSIYGLMIFFAILNMPFIWTYHTTESKTNWEEFSMILEQNTNKGDYIVYVPNYMQLPADYYYSNKTDETITFGANSLSDVMNVSRNNNSIYYVMTGDIGAVDTSGRTPQWISENSKLVRQYGEIYLFKR